MSAQTLMFLLMGATCGGFVNGLTGTGTALFALGFYLVVLDPVTAVAIVALMSVMVGLQGLWIVRAEIFARPKRLARFALPGLVGVPIGLSLLQSIDASVLRIAIGTLLIVYGCYFGFRRALKSLARPTPVIDMIVGFLGGVLGGTAAVSGAIPVIWLSIRPWPKSETRAVLQPFNIAILSTTVAALFFDGGYDRTALLALLVTVPTGFVAAQIGILAFRRVSDTVYRRLLILLAFAMGLGILISELV